MTEIIKQNVEVLLDYVVSGVDFVVDQAPMVVQQALTYYTYRSVVYMVLGFVLLIILCFFIVKLIKGGLEEKEDPYGNDGIYHFLFAGIFSLGGMILLSISLTHLVQLIHIKTAPALFILKVLKTLL